MSYLGHSLGGVIPLPRYHAGVLNSSSRQSYEWSILNRIIVLAIVEFI